MTQGNGQPTVYRVSQLGTVKQALRDHYHRAQAEGIGKQYLAAVQHIYQRLRQDPHGFGEPKFNLPAMQMVVHVAIHRPLIVAFGIHQTEPLVVIRSIRYLD